MEYKNKMVFKSDRQRKAFWAKTRGSSNPQIIQFSNRQITIFSYFDGRKLGKFKNINEFFKNNPKERQAFERVMKFNRQTGMNVTTINQIKDILGKSKRFSETPEISKKFPGVRKEMKADSG